jgi:hypothetical protein
VACFDELMAVRPDPAQVAQITGGITLHRDAGDLTFEDGRLWMLDMQGVLADVDRVTWQREY